MLISLLQQFLHQLVEFRLDFFSLPLQFRIVFDAATSGKHYERRFFGRFFGGRGRVRVTVIGFAYGDFDYFAERVQIRLPLRTRTSHLPGTALLKALVALLGVIRGPLIR